MVGQDWSCVRSCPVTVCALGHAALFLEGDWRSVTDAPAGPETEGGAFPKERGAGQAPTMGSLHAGRAPVFKNSSGKIFLGGKVTETSRRVCKYL